MHIEQAIKDTYFQMSKYKIIMLWLMKKTIRNNIKTYKNITKTATGRRDDYTTNRLLDYF